MKKLTLCILTLLIILGVAGCRQGNKFVTADDVTENTIVAKSNGLLQVATVEDFSKSYYNQSELQKFITSNIDEYNKEAGGDKITVDEVKLRNGKAIMILKYSGMDDYAAFNKESAAYFNGGVENVGLDLPETLVNAKDESLVSTQEILKDSKNKILIMNEPYHIIVDGKVKYYSDNAELVDKKSIRSASKGMTIVVFKP